MRQLKRCKPALGTYVSILLSGDTSASKLLSLSESVFSEIARIENLMSFHSATSELSRINREASRGWVEISAEMNWVLSFALDLSARTEGAFDLSVATALVKRRALPDHGYRANTSGNWRHVQLEQGRIAFTQSLLLDLGGIAKGFAVDAAFALIPEEITLVINAGGDLRMRPWQDESLAVRVPGNHQRGLCVEVAMAAAAVATSAAYFGEGIHPVLDPTSGEPLHDQRSVSVFAPDCMTADALTKAVFLRPECDALLRQFEASALIVDPDGHQHWQGMD